MYVRKPGSLSSLKALLNRRNVPKKPSSNMNESEDFLDVVTGGHVLESFMTFAGMESIDSSPSK